MICLPVFTGSRVKQLWVAWNLFWLSFLKKSHVRSKSLQSCLTLCDPMDCSLARLLCPWDSPRQECWSARGLLRVGAGNPWFPRLVPVISGRSKGASENSGILWCWEGPLGTPLSLVQWKRASSLVEVGTSGFLSISDSNRRVPEELGQEGKASSCVKECNFTCLSSCSRGDSPHLEL